MKSKLFLFLTIAVFALTACATPAPKATPTEVPADPYPAEATAEATLVPTEPYPVAEPTGATVESYTVVDALGREVSFDKVPERIALVGKGVFMVADAVYTFPETSTNVIAIAAMNQKSEAFLKMIDLDYASKQSIDRTAGPEQIAALQPDCVILKTTNPDVGAGLDTLQIPYIYVDFETPEQYSRDLQTLGQLFQNPDRATALSSFFTGNVKMVETALANLTEEEKPDTLLLYYNELDGAIAFNVAPAAWMQTTIVEMAGGNPVWKDSPLDKGWTKVSLEQVAAWNPEVIVVTAYTLSIPDVVEKLKADPQWQELEAVKNGKLYGMAADVYSFDQPDTRWALGVEWLAATLHPDRFQGYDLTQSAQKFYQVLYNLDETSFQQNIAPILTGATN